jgi:hypothetical protein
MKQAPDRNAFAQLVETLNGSLCLQDLDGNAFVDQHFECLWTDLEPAPRSLLDSTTALAPCSINS